MTPDPGSAPAGTIPGHEAVAALLASPDTVRSVQQPVVELHDGHCSGYNAAVRVAEWVGRESGPWFRAAATAGLSGHLAGLSLSTCLRARATMPGERFLVTEVSGRVLTSDPVSSVLADEDDVGDLVLTLSGPLGPGAHGMIHDLRQRGLRFAAPAGSAGLAELQALAVWRPDVIVVPPEMVRGIERDPLRQALVALVVDLAEDMSHNLYGGAPAGPDSVDRSPAVISSAACGVIAEGVETLAEVAALRDLGVRWAHGWLMGRLRAGFQPPAVDLQSWVASLDVPEETPSQTVSNIPSQQEASEVDVIEDPLEDPRPQEAVPSTA